MQSRAIFRLDDFEIGINRSQTEKRYPPLNVNVALYRILSFIRALSKESEAERVDSRSGAA